MVDWGRRFITVSVFIPLAVYCLLDDFRAGLLVWFVCSGACWEMVYTVVPQAVQAALPDGPGKPQVAARLPWTAQAVAFASSALILAVPILTPSTALWEAACLVSVVAVAATFMLGMHSAHTAVAAADGQGEGKWRMDPAALLGLLMLLCTPLLLASPLSYATRVRALPSGMALQIIVGGAIWNADSGALVVGSAIGRPKLLPSVSPGKTVAGFLGSFVGAGATIGLAVCSQQVPSLVVASFPAFSTASWVALSALVGAGAVLGDLLESSMKRAAGVKDSGGVLPGQGGLLDRMDSALFVIPLVYHLVSLGVLA